jgi:hypothetical protein
MTDKFPKKEDVEVKWLKDKPIGKFSERDLKVEFLDNKEGWHVEEYVGIGIVNLWSMFPQEIISYYRKRNKWTRWLCFEYRPVHVNGKLRLKLKWSNPLTTIKKVWLSRKIKNIMLKEDRKFHGNSRN